MSAYARAAAALGARVSGSDRAESPFSRALRADGVLDAQIGHRPENLPAGEGIEVVHSSAIGADNAELRAASRRGLTIRSRAELLAELTALRRTIAVAGAHGKTTTASMIVCALRGAGLDPGYLIGGTLLETGRNGSWGSGEWLVVEADESDGSMLSLTVEIAVLTSVELDHHDRYGSLAELADAYRRFLELAPSAVVWDREQLRALRRGPLLAYDAQSVPGDGGGGARFTFAGRAVTLRVPGAHNAINAAAALSVCTLVGIELEPAIAALAAFPGAARRFERLGESPGGAAIYDDYAHHPTEVAATLAAARTLSPKRLVAIFQPHLYSRTRALAREFGAALAAADVIVVLDVYAARERAEDFPGVSGLLIARAAASLAGGRPVYWLGQREHAAALLAALIGKGDLVIAMGAGDVDVLGRQLAGLGAQDG
jgi:UDP-N-acetylmuramate--alanine ligase